MNAFRINKLILVKSLNGVWLWRKRTKKIKGKHSLTFVSDLFPEASEHQFWQISHRFSNSDKKSGKRKSYSCDKLKLTLLLCLWHKGWLHLCPEIRMYKRGHDGPHGSQDAHRLSGCTIYDTKWCKCYTVSERE